MTQEEFLKEASIARIRPSSFEFDDSMDECYVLIANSSQWTVYYSERGEKSHPCNFATESEALLHLLALLQNDPSTKV